MRVSSLHAAFAAFVLSAGLFSQSPLTTLFMSNNRGSDGGAVFFDLTTGATGVQVNAFDLSLDPAGAPAGIDVYVRRGSHAGNGGSSAGWFFISSDTGGVTAAGPDLQTNLPLRRPFCVPANTTIGVAIVAAPTVGHNYTNGSGTPCGNCTYSTPNGDLTFTGGEATNAPFIVSPFSPRIANCNVYYTLSPGCSLFVPSDLVGVAEATAGAGTLSGVGSAFEARWFLRWNFTDPVGSNAGQLGAAVINIGIGGSAPIGVTPAIPGFNQLSTLSMPAGPAIIGPLQVIGGGDASFRMPGGILGLGDTLRFQGLVFDIANSLGGLPVVPTPSTIEFTYSAPCQLGEGFETVPSGLGNYPMGWSDGGGTDQWQVDAGGTPSSGTGPSAAIEGVNYFYTETSGSHAATDTWIMNTAVYPNNTFSANGLGFQLSRVGSTIGTLEVRMGDGSGTFPTQLETFAGPGNSEWEAVVIPLPTPLPANVQFQVHYTYGGSFTGDLAIDDFCLM